MTHRTGRLDLRRAALALALFVCTTLILASCGAPVATSYKQPEGVDLTKLSWTDAFEKLNDKMSREYAFTQWKGIDWEEMYSRYSPRVAKAQESNDKAAYYLALREYINELRDGHASVKPDDPEVYAALAGGGFGIIVTVLDNAKVAVTWLKDGGPAAAAGISLGAEVVRWDGKPVRAALAATSTALAPPQPTDPREVFERARFLVRSPVGAEKQVAFRNPGESASTTVTLKAVDDGMETLAMTDSRSVLSRGEVPGAMVEQKMLTGDVGYVRIVAEVDMPQGMPGDHTPTLELFRKAIDDLVAAKATGIVVDVRGNSGGSDTMVSDFMSSFYKKKTFYEYQNYIVPSTGQFQIWIVDDETGQYSDPGQGLWITPAQDRFAGPIVCLIDNACISSGEGVAMGIRNLPNGETVGFYGTNGSFGMAGDGAEMPGGYSVSFPFGQSLDKDKVVQLDSKDGKGGVLPSKKVPLALDNVIKAYSGQDVVLDYGLSVLKTMK